MRSALARASDRHAGGDSRRASRALCHARRRGLVLVRHRALEPPQLTRRIGSDIRAIELRGGARRFSTDGLDAAPVRGRRLAGAGRAQQTQHPRRSGRSRAAAARASGSSHDLVGGAGRSKARSRREIDATGCRRRCRRRRHRRRHVGAQHCARPSTAGRVGSGARDWSAYAGCASRRSARPATTATRRRTTAAAWSRRWHVVWRFDAPRRDQLRLLADAEHCRADAAQPDRAARAEHARPGAGQQRRLLAPTRAGNPQLEPEQSHGIDPRWSVTSATAASSRQTCSTAASAT